MAPPVPMLTWPSMKDRRADDDVEIGRTIEADIADAARINAARAGFEAVKNLHGAKFRRARHGAARESRAQAIDYREFRAKLGGDRATSWCTVA